MYIRRNRALKRFYMEIIHRRMRIWVSCPHVDPLIQSDFIENFTTVIAHLKNSSCKSKFGASKLWN